MGIFKSLDRSDIFLSDYTSKKKWIISGSELGSRGILVQQAHSSSVPIETGEYEEGSYESRILYRSLYNNYYSGSLVEGVVSGSADLCLQTTITSPGMRILPTTNYHPAEHVPYIVLISFPSNLIGSHIDVGSFAICPREDGINYVENDYVQLEDVPTRKDKFYFEDMSMGDVVDREGVLMSEKGTFTGNYITVEGFNYPVPERLYGGLVGDIIYNQGQVIITEAFWAWYFSQFPPENLRFISNVSIFTLNVGCKVLDHEFNCTFNKTAKNVNGTKDFSPYITSVGLYNVRNELIAVAKLSQPIKKLDCVDMTINISIDLT